MNITWQDSLSVSNEKIDQQHKNLINMLNTAVSIQHKKPNSEEVSELLQELSRYAHDHFKVEEEYMLEMSYPDFDKHKSQHKLFREKIACLCLEAFSKSEAVATDLLNYLSEWFLNHIKNTDQMYAQFADQQ